MKKKHEYAHILSFREQNKIIRIMKLSFIFTVLFSLQIFAGVYSQSKALSLNIKDVTVKEVFKAIEGQSNFRFFYNDELSDVNRLVSIKVNSIKLESILAELFEQSNVTYQILENNLIVIAPKQVIQPKEVNGIITDAVNSEPIFGANIIIEGTSIGVITDINGKFRLDVTKSDAIVIVSYLGYNTERVAVNGQKTLNVKLVPDITKLDEIVVVGYGTQKKSLIIGSSSSISENQFKAQPITRVDQILQGRASGVQITNSGGAPGGDVRIRVRGSNSFSGDNEPLYVIDGFVGGDFNTVNPDDISSIEVLKDAASTAIYGSRGANGVILISTKKGTKGDMKLTFGYRNYSSNVLKKLNTLDAPDFAEVVNERLAAYNQPARFSEAEIAEYRKSGGTNWQDEIFRTAPGSEYQIGASGGNEKTNFLISVNYLNQDGIILNSNFKRYSVRSNISSQISKKFSTRFIFNGSRRENLNTGGTGARSSVLSQALSWAPTTSVRNSTGGYVYIDPTSALFQNPVALALECETLNNRSNANILSGIRYDIIEGLSLDVQFGLNYLSTHNKTFNGILSDISPIAYAGRASSEDITWQNTNTLNYTKTINSVHNFDITLVNENQKYTGTGFNVNVSDLTYPDLKYDNLSLSKSSNIGSGYSSWALTSLLGHLNFRVLINTVLFLL